VVSLLHCAASIASGVPRKPGWSSIVAEGAAVGVGLEVAVAVDEVVVEVALEAAGSYPFCW